LTKIKTSQLSPLIQR